MGFKECVVTGSMKNDDWSRNTDGLTLVPCRRIGELQEKLF
jgi:hypothetical protein